MKKKRFFAGENIKTENANWSFKGSVPKNFDKHIVKSVPLYEWSHELGLKVSDFFLPNNSLVYDIGCSTGSFIKNLADRHKNKSLKIYGIDEIKQMVEISKKKNKKNKNVKILQENLINFKLKKSNLISSFYTIQFIHPSKRQKLFNHIYQSLEWGGAFIFFEKVRGPDARFQDMISQIYQEYKIDQGYSSEEIIAKSRSLKGVLEPFTSKANNQYLTRAGFKDVYSIMKFLCFEGWVAIK